MSCLYSIPVPNLKVRYAEVLSHNTASAFVRGKTSFKYCEYRLRSVLVHFGVNASVDLTARLLQTHDAALTSSLELKPGALDLQIILRSEDKKIAVITEGPQDAQECTIRALRIDRLIDFLATTNKCGLSKTNGLFPKVLEHLGIETEEMVMIGDNYEGDMRLAIRVSISGIQPAENEEYVLDSEPVKINTLRIP